MSVYHRTEGWTQEDGSVRVFNDTNDNEDRGYESDSAHWESICRDREAFIKRYGKSGHGCMGANVIVELDGVRI